MTKPFRAFKLRCSDAFIVCNAICFYRSDQTFQNLQRMVINMVYKDVVVRNKVGLHARPATFFIQKANEFRSTIWVEKEERRVNAKSLLGVLSLGIIGGSNIRIVADGSDENEAVNALVALLESGLEEN